MPWTEKLFLPAACIRRHLTSLAVPAHCFIWYMPHCTCILMSEINKQNKHQNDQDGLLHGLVLISHRLPRCIALEGHPRWDTDVRYVRSTTRLTVALTCAPRPLYATHRYNPASRLDACSMNSRHVATDETTSVLAPTSDTVGLSTWYHVINPNTLTGFARTTHSSVTVDVSLTTCSGVTFTISAATVENTNQAWMILASNIAQRRRNSHMCTDLKRTKFCKG